MARSDELIEVLRRLGRARGPELARVLEISPATLSRAVRAAGDDVCRMGRRRGATYALRRPVAGLPPRIPVFRIDRAGRPARLGELSPLHDGGHWLDRGGERGVAFAGTPPFVADMQPQGYLGAGFARRHPDLDLPARLSDWNDDHRLIAVARRGEDCIGNLLIGEESFDRFGAMRESAIEPVPDSAWPQRAERVLADPAGSSAGGEAPKFLAYGEVANAHVLVKFTSGTRDEADGRWRDLLVCEELALATLREHGIDTPATRVVDVGDRRFLESARFDRVGRSGRLGVVSMAAFDAEHIGAGSDWTRVAGAMRDAGWISAQDRERIAWLDVFGNLIGNTDRHLGNITFLSPDPDEQPRTLRLAPVYDMLPMVFAPSAGRVLQAGFAPRAPRAADVEAWTGAIDAATGFWRRVLDEERIGSGFRTLSESALGTLSRLGSLWSP